MSEQLPEGQRRIGAGRRALSRAAVVLAYAAVGAAWIALSDRLIPTFRGVDQQVEFSTLKGLGYIGVTAAGLWLLLLLRDHGLERGRRALTVSEERYRMLAERSHDVVYRYRLGADPGYEYISPSVTGLLGFTPDAFYADRDLGRRLMESDDLASLREAVVGSSGLGSAGQDAVTARWRTRDGRTIWVEHRMTAIRNATGALVAVEGTARDVTARVQAELQRDVLTRAVEESPTGIVVTSAVVGEFRIEYVNAALATLLGRSPAELVGEPSIAFGQEVTPEVQAAIGAEMLHGRPARMATVLHSADGTERPVSLLASPVLGRSGEIERVISVVQDMSETTALGQAQSHLASLMDAMPLAVVATDRAGLVTGWNPAAERLFGWSAAEVTGRPLPFAGDLAEWLAEPRSEDALTGPSAADAGPGGGGSPVVESIVRIARRDGVAEECRVFGGPITAPDGRPMGSVLVIEDLTPSRLAEETLAQLELAIDQSGEAIVITDPGGRIVYVNPAFERVSGYARDELLGENPRILRSGVIAGRVYEELWRAITNGETWRGLLVNRRKDGSLYEEEATISPVLGTRGETIAYVAVKRDLTLEHSLAAGLTAELNDRAAVQEAMGHLEAGATPEETAASLCRAVAEFPSIEKVIVTLVPAGDGPLVPLATILSDEVPGQVGVPCSPELSRYVRTRSADGPWGSEGLGRDPAVIGIDGMAGLSSIVAPIRYRGALVGVVFAGARVDHPEAWIARHLRVVAELATHVGPLLGPQLAERGITDASRSQVRAVIDRSAFFPVFQPVCDLTTRVPVGWEALTRFMDGTPVSQRFAEAHALGMGETLEVATAMRALDTFRLLHREGWLSLNVSPGVVLSEEAARLVRAAGRPVVFELTEHVAIDDYARLRAAIAAIEPRPRIAVDDAGAGYASLRHVLELRPDFVKLDIGLVRAIDRDAARQAMVAGMVHYAAETGTALIAEGVETEDERRTLLALGVRYGQGFLLGRPSASADMTTDAPDTGGIRGGGSAATSARRVGRRPVRTRLPTN